VATSAKFCRQCGCALEESVLAPNAKEKSSQPALGVEPSANDPNAVPPDVAGDEAVQKHAPRSGMRVAKASVDVPWPVWQKVAVAVITLLAVVALVTWYVMKDSAKVVKQPNVHVDSERVQPLTAEQAERSLSGLSSGPSLTPAQQGGGVGGAAAPMPSGSEAGQAGSASERAGTKGSTTGPAAPPVVEPKKQAPVADDLQLPAGRASIY